MTFILKRVLDSYSNIYRLVQTNTENLSYRNSYFCRKHKSINLTLSALYQTRLQTISLSLTLKVTFRVFSSISGSIIGSKRSNMSTKINICEHRNVRNAGNSSYEMGNILLAQVSFYLIFLWHFYNCIKNRKFQKSFELYLFCMFSVREWSVKLFFIILPCVLKNKYC